MGTVIEIPPEVEAAIRAEAGRQGTTPGAVVCATLSDRFLQPLQKPQAMTAAEQSRRFQDWKARHRSPGPPIPEGALSRDTLYD